MIDLETLHIIEIEIIPMIGKETFQMLKDQNIITIKIDHATIHRIEIQVLTTDKETTLNHHRVITHVIKIHNTFIEVVHPNLKDKSIK